MIALWMHWQVLQGALTAEAEAGSGADSAVQLAALHSLATALGTPNARAALQQVVQQQPPKQRTAAPAAAAGGSTGGVLLQSALQCQTETSGNVAASAVAKGPQPALHFRSDAATWRALAASGSRGSEAKPPPSSLAELLLSTACGRHMQL